MAISYIVKNPKYCETEEELEEEIKKQTLIALEKLKKQEAFENENSLIDNILGS